MNLDPNRPMSDEEKKELSRSIRNLNAQQLKGIISIVRDMFPEKDGMLEFDIDTLPPAKCRELEEYVREVKKTGNKPIKPLNSKPLPRQNSKGFSNNLPNLKGNQTQNRAKSSNRPDDLNRKGINSYNQSGLMDSSNPLGGSKDMIESSDSDSESSNSSIGSLQEIPSGLPNKKSFSHMQNLGEMPDFSVEFNRNYSTKDHWRNDPNRE